MNPTAKSDNARSMTYANTVDGQILPVIDITDPRFALPTDSNTLAAFHC
ncbi:hypothetical protein [Paraburkholderia sacchari]